MGNPFAPIARGGDDDRRWEPNFKIDLPEFNGNMDLDEFLDWLNVAEEILVYKDVPLDHRVILVCTRLRGRVVAWLKQMKHTRNNQGKSRILH